MVGSLVARSSAERPSGWSLGLDSVIPDKFDATDDWCSHRRGRGGGVSGREDDVLVDVRELECFGAGSRHASATSGSSIAQSYGSFSDQSPGSSVGKPHPPYAADPIVRENGPGSRPATDECGGFVVVVVCEVVAVEDDVLDEVCVCVRCVLVVVGGGRTIGVGFGIAANTRCAS